jgi:pimeloyl-ACP methyl ester carboxylesterase
MDDSLEGWSTQRSDFGPAPLPVSASAVLGVLIALLDGCGSTEPVQVATVTISPASVNVEIGATQQLTATLKDRDGIVLTGRAMRWSTSDPTLVTVSASGMVTGVTTGGPVTVTATSEGISGQAQVAVLDPIVGAQGASLRSGSGATFAIEAGAVISGGLRVQLADIPLQPGAHPPASSGSVRVTLSAVGALSFAQGQEATVRVPLSGIVGPGEQVLLRVDISPLSGLFLLFPVTVAAGGGISRIELAELDFLRLETATGMLQLSLTLETFEEETPPPLPVSVSPQVTASPGQATRLVGCNSFPLDPDPASSPTSGTNGVAIIVVHGWLWSVGNCADFLAQQLTPGNGILGIDYFSQFRTALIPRYGQLDAIYYFTYPTYNDVRVSGAWLAFRIKSLLTTRPFDRVVIVAHSMGGLVSRVAAANLEADPLTMGKVRGIITLATPHLGSPLADRLKGVPWYPTAGVRSLSRTALPIPSEPVPIFGYAGNLRSRATPPGIAWPYRLTYRWLCPLPSPSPGCDADGVVEVSSASPQFILRGRREIMGDYDHTQMHETRMNSGNPNDPLYQKVFADIDVLSATGTLPLVPTGDARTLGTGIRLTAAQVWQRGAAWTPTRRTLRAGFVANFSFRLSAPGGIPDATGSTGADGFAFVIQGEGGAALGALGEEQGYGGITRSLAIEFDTWQNFTDPDGNHVSIQTRGASANSAQHAFSLGFATPTFELADGNVHSVRVEYLPGVLKVYVDGVLLQTSALDLDNILGASILDGAGTAWLGFTAATGSGFENHDILDWSLLP